MPAPAQLPKQLPVVSPFDIVRRQIHDYLADRIPFVCHPFGLKVGIIWHRNRKMWDWSVKFICSGGDLPKEDKEFSVQGTLREGTPKSASLKELFDLFNEVAPDGDKLYEAIGKMIVTRLKHGIELTVETVA